LRSTTVCSLSKRNWANERATPARLSWLLEMSHSQRMAQIGPYTLNASTFTPRSACVTCCQFGPLRETRASSNLTSNNAGRCGETSWPSNPHRRLGVTSGTPAKPPKSWRPQTRAADIIVVLAGRRSVLKRTSRRLCGWRTTSSPAKPTLHLPRCAENSGRDAPATKIIPAQLPEPAQLALPYELYTDEDVAIASFMSKRPRLSVHLRILPVVARLRCANSPASLLAELQKLLDRGWVNSNCRSHV